ARGAPTPRRAAGGRVRRRPSRRRRSPPALESLPWGGPADRGAEGRGAADGHRALGISSLVRPPRQPRAALEHRPLRERRNAPRVPGRVPPASLPGGRRRVLRVAPRGPRPAALLHPPALTPAEIGRAHV